MRTEVMSVGAVPSSAPFSALFRGVRRWLAYRDTAHALNGLSRRELSDIGVDTSVDDFAWKVAEDAARRF